MTDARVEGVRSALDVALRDYQHPTPVALSLEAGTTHGGDLVWVTSPDGSRTGIHVARRPSGPELLVQVADFLQDQVFDQLAETWGEARPPCPGHQHAANPELRDGEAWWRCPRSGEWLARIGELRQT